MIKSIALVVLTLLVGLCQAAGIDDRDDRAERDKVLAVDDAWGAAEVAKDTAALGRILDDLFVFNDSDGTTSGKADLLAKVANWPLTGEALSERTMVLVGSTAVVFGTTELTFATKSGGERKSRFRYTATYVKRGADWRALAIQMNPRGPAP